ncbi:MAG: hypothetical protein L7F77_12955, partial [Candidatus Magnetominusculus sp. LBB02]|nr:hypothetical protein [Candidatus Magnetominusculus sp. LBB02]
STILTDFGKCPLPSDLKQAAIYEAVNSVGFFVVAAYPVHAELRASSPKAATKDPISLDAILVCRKKPHAVLWLIDDVVRKTDELACKFVGAGMGISSADRFVIAASQMLIATSAERLSFEKIRERLEALRLRLSLNGNTM